MPKGWWVLQTREIRGFLRYVPAVRHVLTRTVTPIPFVAERCKGKRPLQDESGNGCEQLEELHLRATDHGIPKLLNNMLWVHGNHMHSNSYHSIYIKYSVLQFLVGIALQLAQCNLHREAVVDVQPFPARQTTFQLRCRCKRTGPVFPTQVRMEMLRLDVFS